MTFIFFVGVFMSSWLGASLLSLGEWIIKKMPLMSYIYTASKQISSAISPGNKLHLFYISKLILIITNTVLISYRATLLLFSDEDSHAFKEVAIIRHPRLGEYAFGFITSTIILRKSTGAEELCCVYVPTNHLYLGDVFLINSKDIMRPNLSVREGIGKSLNFNFHRYLRFLWYDRSLFSWHTFLKEETTYVQY